MVLRCCCLDLLLSWPSKSTFHLSIHNCSFFQEEESEKIRNGNTDMCARKKEKALSNNGIGN